MISIIGIITEIMGIYLISRIAPWLTPVYVVSILFMIIALYRWGEFGLVLILVFSVAGFLAGKYLHTKGGTYYTWQAFISDFIGLLGTSIVLLLKKKFHKNEINKSVYGLLGMSFATIISVVFLQGTTYAILSNQNWVSSLVSHFFDSLFALLATMVFIIVIKNQNVIVDVKENLIATAEERRKEKEYYKEYTKEIVVKKNDKKKT